MQLADMRVVVGMSKYSTMVDGKHQEIAFRNKRTIPNEVHGPTNNYVLYVGDEAWGSVWDMHRSWTAVAGIGGEMNLVEGFATRLDAAFYIIKYIKSRRDNVTRSTQG
jgi:hypothetical protein